MNLKSHAVFWSLATIAFVAFSWVFRDVLFPFVLGATIAYLLEPILEKIVAKGMGRKSAVLLILGTFFLLLTGILAVLLPILVREASAFITAFPGYLDHVLALVQPHIAWAQERLGYQVSSEEIQGLLKENIGKALKVGQGVLGGLASGGQAVADFFLTALLTPVAAYFMMKEWPSITAWVYGLIPVHSETTVKTLLSEINRKIAGFVRGQIMVCLILGAMYAVALSIAGLNYGFVIGLGTGILSIIPYVGSTLGLVISLVVAGLQSGGDWAYIGIIAAIFFTGQFLEGNFITPKLMGDSVGLHPLWIMFALMAGGAVLGILGMFLAIPVAAIIGVLVAFAIQQYRLSAYYNKPGSAKAKKDKADNATPPASA
jgi:predicted PurR-regulated permease PerM